MTIYALIPLGKNFNQIKNFIELSFKEDNSNYFELPSEAGFLLNFSGTSQELTNFIEITKEGDNKAALIVPFNSFWGVGPVTMWEWIQNKMEK